QERQQRQRRGGRPGKCAQPLEELAAVERAVCKFVVEVDDALVHAALPESSPYSTPGAFAPATRGRRLTFVKRGCKWARRPPRRRSGSRQCSNLPRHHAPGSGPLTRSRC